MKASISEDQLIQLLKECVPYLRFCVGGTDVDEVLGKVVMVLELAGRKVEEHA